MAILNKCAQVNMKDSGRDKLLIWRPRSQIWGGVLVGKKRLSSREKAGSLVPVPQPLIEGLEKSLSMLGVPRIVQSTICTTLTVALPQDHLMTQKPQDRLFGLCSIDRSSLRQLGLLCQEINQKRKKYKSIDEYNDLLPYQNLKQENFLHFTVMSYFFICFGLL